MIYVNNLACGFLLYIGAFMASVLIKALFHSGICG